MRQKAGMQAWKGCAARKVKIAKIGVFMLYFGISQFFLRFFLFPFASALS